MKINAAGIALLAATAAAVPITSVGTTTTPRLTWTVGPTSTTTAADVEVCMMPNRCGPIVSGETAPAKSEPAATSATFEACVMPDGCSDKSNSEAASTGLPPKATPPPINRPSYRPVPSHTITPITSRI